MLWKILQKTHPPTFSQLPNKYYNRKSKYINQINKEHNKKNSIFLKNKHRSWEKERERWIKRRREVNDHWSVGGFEGGEIGEWIWRWRDRWVGLKETTPTLTRSVCRSEIMLAFWHLFVRENERGREKTKGFLDRRCRSIGTMTTVLWGWCMNLRCDLTGEGRLGYLLHFPF